MWLTNIARDGISLVVDQNGVKHSKDLIVVVITEYTARVPNNEDERETAPALRLYI